MPKIAYQTKDFKLDTLALIAQCNEIVTAYGAQGLDLTLRQLYYQLVSRNVIRNLQKEYARLSSIVNDARLAGLIDWDSITDRTRNLRKLSHWQSPTDIIAVCAQQFRKNKWLTQDNYVEVWIEKDALVGVIEGVCNEYDVPHFSCRGYTSQSEMWGAAMRLVERLKAGKQCTILHLGDHDPSGIDMSRDIEERLRMFIGKHTNRVSMFEVKRIALLMSQIEQYNPPPNPAKATDARFVSYEQEFGDECWELDALEPSVIIELVRGELDELRDLDTWNEVVEDEDEAKENIGFIAQYFDAAAEAARLESES